LEKIVLGGVEMKKIWIVLLVVGTLVTCVTMDTARWAEDSYVTQLADIESQKWSKVNKELITGDMFGALAEAHLGPEGFRQVYINSIGKAVSMGKADFPYPVGTFVMKEAFENAGGTPGDLAAYTIMVKRGDSYDPANGNWEYLMFNPAKEVMAQGKIDMCIGCHAAVADKDYVFNDRRM
jgi:hypothetical protein